MLLSFTREISTKVICPNRDHQSNYLYITTLRLHFMPPFEVCIEVGLSLLPENVFNAGVSQFMQYFNISMSYREDADIRDAITLIMPRSLMYTIFLI